MINYYFILLAFVFYGCSSSSLINHEIELIDISHIQANLQVLASDEFEGREATTRGEKLASLFITTELRKYGVEPFFGDSSYLQPFELTVMEIDTLSNLLFTTQAGEIKLSFAEDFVFRGKSDDSAVSESQFIFAGFGISASEYFYDNYLGLDVRNKYVMILDGEPESNDSLFFEGSADTKYSKNDYKISTAREKGALGCLIFASDNTQKYWSFIKQYSPKSRFSLPNSEAQHYERNFYYLLNQKTLSRLLNSEQDIYNEVKNKLSISEDCKSIGLYGTVTFSITQEEEKRTSYNIAGVIPGNDPALRNEYVAIGAHYDHEGIVNGIVYNGADDDASGTVAVMEIARALAQAQDNKRSILVVFHAAEEKGLLGSRYFTDHLDIIDNTIAQINLDMIGREHIDSIYSVGSDKLTSELKTIVEDVNRNTVGFIFNYKFDDPSDPERIYYRSDHYNYAKHGIPVVFFTDGMDEDYHKPTDDYEKIDFEKIEKISKLVYGIVERLSNLDHRLVIDKSY